ncbi:MAG TPA: hypothetical protein VI702_02235 [Nitrospiria bacterium]
MLDGIEAALKKAGVGCERMAGSEGSLMIGAPDEDSVVELYPDGRFACQFGVDMEELRGLLTGDQTEDMADDELVRVARYHLKPTVDRHRAALIKEGLEESVDATKDYYAIVFGASFDLSDPQSVLQKITRILAVLKKAPQ